MLYVVGAGNNLRISREELGMLQELHQTADGIARNDLFSSHGNYFLIN